MKTSSLIHHALPFALLCGCIVSPDEGEEALSAGTLNARCADSTECAAEESCVERVCSSAGCDEDLDCDTHRACVEGLCVEPQAGGEAIPDVADAPASTPTRPAYLWIVDASWEENQAGTPGVDICGVYAECDGVTFTGSARLETDDDQICDAEMAYCSADRTNPSAAEDEGAHCDGASSPISDYVCLGMGGGLMIEFAGGLRGCDVYVIELDGSDAEGAEVFLCDEPSDSSSCERLGSFETIGSGPGVGASYHFEA